MSFLASVLTLMPEMFPGPLGHSLTGTALANGLWRLDVRDLRQFGLGRHRAVDDTPAGGGPGMVMRADVVGPALDAAQAAAPAGSPLVYLSPRGLPFTQAQARALAAGPGVILLCGRFEGLDERVLAGRPLREVSLGDFVLSGGEIAAMALLDATVRLIPGVLGDAASLAEESFEDDLLEYPHYTRPQVWEGREIPAVLTSGNHAAIAAFRRRAAEEITRRRRPDLWARHVARTPQHPRREGETS